MSDAICTCTHTEGAHNQEGGRCAVCACTGFEAAPPDTRPWVQCGVCGWSGPVSHVHACSPRRSTPREAFDIIIGAIKAHDREIARADGQLERTIREALEAME